MQKPKAILLVLHVRRIALEYEIKDQPHGRSSQDDAASNRIHRQSDMLKPDCAIDIPEQECG